MPFDIQLQIFWSLSELAIIIWIVKAATCGAQYKFLNRKMGITYLMKNCPGEPEIWRMTFSCRYCSRCPSSPYFCRLWRLPSKPYSIKSFTQSWWLLFWWKIVVKNQQYTAWQSFHKLPFIELSTITILLYISTQCWLSFLDFLGWIHALQK